MAQNAPAAQHPQKGTNGFAIAALITGLVGLNLLGIIFGFVALNQIKQTGESGRGMAIAGIILGFVWIVVVIGLVLWTFVFVSSVTNTIIQTPSTFNTLFNELNSSNFQLNAPIQ